MAHWGYSDPHLVLLGANLMAVCDVVQAAPPHKDPPSEKCPATVGVLHRALSGLLTAQQTSRILPLPIMTQCVMIP